MRGALVLVSVVALVLGACGGGQDVAANTGMVSITEPSGEAIVISTRVVIAAVEGADIPATGEILEGSTLGSEPFCVGGTTQDRHASGDPAMEPYGLLDRTITCPDGNVKMAFTPGQPQGLIQGGSWTIVSGTGAYEGLRGSGEMDVTYDASDDSLAHERLTGTVTR